MHNSMAGGDYYLLTIFIASLLENVNLMIHFLFISFGNHSFDDLMP